MQIQIVMAFMYLDGVHFLVTLDMVLALVVVHYTVTIHTSGSCMELVILLSVLPIQ